MNVLMSGPQNGYEYIMVEEWVTARDMLSMNRTDEAGAYSLRASCYPAMYNLINMDQEGRKEGIL
jgi:hypothetical protein